MFADYTTQSESVLVAKTLPPASAAGMLSLLAFQSSHALGETWATEARTAASRISTRTVSVLPVPGANASGEDMRNFLHNQLDRIEVMHNRPGSAEAMLEGLKFTGSGPHDRLEGGMLCSHLHAHCELQIRTLRSLCTCVFSTYLCS